MLTLFCAWARSQRQCRWRRRVYVKVDPDPPNQPTTFTQPLKDADDLGEGPRLQWRTRIVCLPVLHGPLVSRDQLIFADSSSDDLRHCCVTNWANDRNNIIV
jgi:hypothetical protein